MPKSAELVSPDPRNIVVNFMREMNPEEFIATLRLIAWNCEVDATRLKEEWQDKDAGKLWDLAAVGLNLTVDKCQKHWDTL